ncbi:MAG: ribosomal RNA small subunit methyltransferase A [Candidatus Zambryskibacteria bacterium RIFCSPLOWO2_12_FULL_45_14]|uniref:Ribosomal RNA small subunit methyltransferase A n=3 Tax=Parcubacteria group TaxID=1794811 RepID=A0A1G2UKG3_9BACT|nr:MAG: ribosomal RNA small subunit methyltransferase A [Candidatus Zambryskibacteria bacterium RIFCSPLOWO2_02_FULL_44_12b]OHB13661.1 MAG: ribosomal RNA small subunit methyltransferase A [Candidatus Zambryskibacteria bacterium RIFCSPLOWO2_12_FULL_45_14]
MRAKKSLGQHFLKSERALRTMVEAGKVTKEDTVLEIGPGRGVLTEKLLAVGCQVIAVEKDDGLFELLEQKFAKEIASSKLTLIHDDILNFKLKIENYKLIANIPYNITGAILKKFLGADCQPERIILLVQKEVAERIIARDKKESILSISVKAYGTPRYVETVKAGSFAPVPKVDSGIIVIENISKAFFQDIAEAVDTPCLRVERGVFEMVRAGFKSKRKKLSSNLSTIFSKDEVKKVFKTLNLDENIRAEDVGTQTWQKLAQNLVV